MQRVIIDSDLLSELVKLKNPNVEAKANAYQLEHKDITFISLTALEILSGLKHINAPAKLKRAEMLLAENEEILPTVEDYRYGSDIVSALWKAGTPIGLVDPMIAACAIRRGLGVASGNTAHFEFIRKLGFNFNLENWRDA
jgi:tRNA(fMet)-specific endonuclease VapC